MSVSTRPIPPFVFSLSRLPPHAHGCVCLQVGYARSWRLALAMTSIIPCVGVAGALMGIFESKYEMYVTQEALDSLHMRLQLDMALSFFSLGSQHISNGGSFAEEVISTIRTAQVRLRHAPRETCSIGLDSQAFGTQQRLASKYDTHMTQAYRLNLKAAIFRAGGLSFFFFAIFSSYGLAFSFGTTLLLQGHGELHYLSKTT